MFTKATAKTASDIAHGKLPGKDGQCKERKGTGAKPQTLTQVSNLQIATYFLTLKLAHTPPTDPTAEILARMVVAVASGAKGWQSLCEQGRVIQGLGKPKSVEPVNAAKAIKRKPAVPVPLP